MNKGIDLRTSKQRLEDYLIKQRRTNKTVVSSHYLKDWWRNVNEPKVSYFTYCFTTILATLINYYIFVML